MKLVSSFLGALFECILFLILSAELVLILFVSDNDRTGAAVVGLHTDALTIDWDTDTTSIDAASIDAGAGALSGVVDFFMLLSEDVDAVDLLLLRLVDVDVVDLLLVPAFLVSGPACGTVFVCFS